MFNKKQIAQSFSKNASNYDRVANLQFNVGKLLLQKCREVHSCPNLIVDVGSGTGKLLFELQGIFPQAKIVALDLAFGMLCEAKKRVGAIEKELKMTANICLINADADQLPLASAGVDLIFCNLMLQWSPNLARTLGELVRILKPNGQLLFSTFGTETLCELRAAWQEVDDAQHVHDFVCALTMEKALKSAGFSQVSVQSNIIRHSYDEVGNLLAELKLLGAHNLHTSRGRGMLGKNKLKLLCSAYEQLRNSQGKLPASFEVLWGFGCVYS